MTPNRGARRAASGRGRPAPAAPTRYAVRLVGGAVVLAAHRPGLPVDLTALPPAVAATLGTDLFVAGLLALPDDQRRARATEFIAAVQAVTPTTEETPHAVDQ